MMRERERNNNKKYYISAVLVDRPLKPIQFDLTGMAFVIQKSKTTDKVNVATNEGRARANWRWHVRWSIRISIQISARKRERDRVVNDQWLLSAIVNASAKHFAFLSLSHSLPITLWCCLYSLPVLSLSLLPADFFLWLLVCVFLYFNHSPIF